MKTTKAKLIVKSLNFTNIQVALFLLLLTTISAFSQTDDFCATPPNTIPDPPGVYSKSTNPGVSDNYIIDSSLNEISIDMTSKPYGWYSVILVCDGIIQDIKSLGKTN